MTARKKWLKRTLIGGGAVFALLLLWSSWVLFGPVGNGIPIGPRTTIIDGPVDAAGYVDYVAFLRETNRVPPEENAAVAVFRILQSDVLRELERPAYMAACEDLGVDPEPDPSVQLPITPHAPNTFAMAAPKDRSIAEDQELRRRHERRMERLKTQPWKSEDHPGIAEWMKTGDAAVAVLRDGIDRPGWWFFPPQQRPLIEYLVPMTQQSRRIARYLSVRVMNHIGDGRFDVAAAEIDLMRRAGERIADGATLIDLLVGIAVYSIAADMEIELLYANDSPEVIRDRLRVIEGHNADHFRRRVVSQYDMLERFLMLEQLQLADRARRGLPGTPPSVGTIGGPSVLQRIALRRSDPEAGSRFVNDLTDRTVNAMRLDTTKEVLAENVEQPSEPQGALAFLDSDFLTRHILSQMLPATEAIGTAVHRARTRKEILRVLAAGRLFELKSGRPPASIDDIVPEFLSEWPVDHYDGEPLRHRTLDGIWSVYGIDPAHGGTAPSVLPASLTVEFPRQPRKDE